MMKEKPLVAVRMLTYNHERYIRKSLEGVLSQVTSFPYVLVIGEDCSTDRTAEICREYEAKFPEKVILHCNPENNLIRNSQRNFEACRDTGAKYIALIEGDDFWTDTGKLESQVKFLEAHPDFAMSAHDVDYVDSRGNIVKLVQKNMPADGILTINDIALKGCILNTCSFVYRNIFAEGFPDWFFKLKTADFAILMLLAQHGKIKFDSRKMAAYRVHSGGVWSGKPEKYMYLNILFNLKVMSSGYFSQDVNALFVQQNRNNFRHVLSRALDEADQATIAEVIDASAEFDPGFSTYFVNEILNPHLRLLSGSRSFKLVKGISSIVKRLKG
jgi:glycosyltransferase involved in cell wall biosynthesis